MHVAILGAAGTIGRNLVPELAARGHTLRVVGRSESTLRQAFADAAEVVAADLGTPGGCAAAVAGMEALVYAVGLPYSARAFAAYGPMMELVAAAARAACVNHLIVISNVYSYGRPTTPRVAETHRRVPASVKGRYRTEQENAALAAHDPAGLYTLVLRLPDFYGPHATNSLSHRIFEAAVANRAASVLGPVDTPHEFVYTPDVARLVGDLLPRRDLFGRAYNFAGPDTITTRQFAERVFRAAGRALQLRAIGPRVQRALGLVVPLMRELAEMAYLQTHPVLLDDRRLREAHPTLHKTPYDQGIRATLAWVRRQSQRHTRAGPEDRGRSRSSDGSPH